ncbi:MAG TPA: hypothetical protein VK200_09720, partial [Candidatus Limnocylindrales bacterium]|nr:hypothetical protein [Candidatus Limnocylindrales bacterium]
MNGSKPKINVQSDLAAAALPASLNKGDVQPPLVTPSNGSTLNSARSTISIVSLGCARNLVDSEVMAGLLQR